MGRFGSSGIRGGYPETIHPSLALRIGRAAGTLCPRILLGHDPRRSSPLLTEAVCAGALSSGARVDLAGPVATPSLAYAARDHDLGLMVTASHNPAEDNGFKFWNPDGSAWLPEQEARFERALEEAPVPAAWDRLHAPRVRTDVAERHLEAVLRSVGPVDGDVVLDTGNGAGAYVSPKLFQKAGLQVELLHGDPDGRFPNRPSEPAPENLSALRDRCRRRKVWGIAHDGDADRMVPVDPAGEVVPADRVLATLARHLGARKVATPVDASLSLAKVLDRVEWVHTRVGDAFVSAAVKTQRCDLGAESSGTYVLPTLDYAPDGPHAALRFLRAVREGTYDEVRAALRPSHRLSEKVARGDTSREDFAARLAQATPEGRIGRVDGLRVDRPQGWFLVRSSGTEPIVRVTAEGATSEDARRLLQEGVAVARRALQD